MALSANQTKALQTLSNMAQQLLALKASMDKYNVMFNGSPAWNTSIQQTDLDASGFAGLQKSDMTAAINTMVGAASTQINGVIASNEAFLAALATFGGN